VKRHTGVAIVSGLSHPNIIDLLLVLNFDPETDGKSLAHRWIGKIVLFRHLRSHKGKEMERKEIKRWARCVFVSFWAVRDPRDAITPQKDVNLLEKGTEIVSHSFSSDSTTMGEKIAHAYERA